MSIAAIAVMSLSLACGWTMRDKQARRRPRRRGLAVQAPPAPELLFNMTLQNETRLPLSQNTITTPNVDVQLYGDGKNIIVAVGKAPTFRGSSSDCAKNPAALRCATEQLFRSEGKGEDQVHDHRVRFSSRAPVIKLADGTLLIGDQAEGSVADYHQYEISFSECRWLRLDPVRGVTLGLG